MSVYEDGESLSSGHQCISHQEVRSRLSYWFLFLSGRFCLDNISKYVPYFDLNVTFDFEESAEKIGKYTFAIVKKSVKHRKHDLKKFFILSYTILFLS